MRLQPIYDIAEICYLKGVRDAVLCPGSRCAPLTIAFARHKGITTRTITDERSAGFVAHGIAQQTRRPVVIICTSGSAAYNLAPAVVEAYYQQTGLIVLTADRPAEWIGQWDGQTIMQQNLYGHHVKRFYQMPQDYDHKDSIWAINRQVNEAIDVSRELPAGPVHINIPLREPLYPEANETFKFSQQIRTTDTVFAKKVLSQKTVNQLTEQLESAKRVLVVGGQSRLDINLNASLHSFAKNTRCVIVGDIISNLHPIPEVIQQADAFLPVISQEALEDMKPDLLITFGQSVIAKQLKLFLRKHKAANHWHVEDGPSRLIDPFQSVTSWIQQDPADFFATFTKELATDPQRDRYLLVWKQMEQMAHQAGREFFDTAMLAEFPLVNAVLNALPDHSILHLANSMTVRYANYCSMPEHKSSVEVFANRGTSGIDGCTSTAIGHALASQQLNTLITGDLAFFYDRNAFWNNYDTPNLRIVVLNNHGGTIFNMIDGPAGLPEGPAYFVTEQRLNASHLAKEFGIDYIAITPATKNIQNILKEFFHPDGKKKILEIQSTTEESKDTFTRFKAKIKTTYGA